MLYILFFNLINLNIIFLYNIFFYNKNIEVDFYIPEKGLLIQACYTLDAEDTYGREKKSLMKALAELDLRKGYIYTWNDAAKTEVLPDGKEIEILPFWKTLNLKTKWFTIYKWLIDWMTEWKLIIDNGKLKTENEPSFSLFAIRYSLISNPFFEL